MRKADVQFSASSSTVFFAIPGSIEARTGGTIYDKRLIAALRDAGWRLERIELAAAFPYPSEADLAAAAESLAACPDGARVLVDGLAFGAMPEIAEREAARLRLVALVHHPLALETGLASTAVVALAAAELRALRCARAVIVTSATTAKTLMADYGVPAAHVTVATPGTDPMASADVPLMPRQIPHLLCVASVTPRKGHDVLVEALASIADLPWRCTMAGSLSRAPDTAARLRRQIEARSLADRVALPGEVDDTAPLYAEADIFVLASRHEGFGMVVAEALAHGLPIVATAAGAVEEVVPAEAGVLVPIDDVAALAAALRDLISNSEHRAALAAGARAAGHALTRWEHTALRVAEVLQGL